MFGRLLDRIVDAQAAWAEPLGGFVQGILKAVFGPMPAVKSFLNGKWLGHPLHAAVTDGPIGILGMVVFFDVVGLGLAATWSAVITVLLMLAAAVTGLADYTDTDHLPRQRATVHATVMVISLVLVVASLALRAAAPTNVALGPAVLTAIALGLVTFGAFVGGDVVYVLGNMVDRHAFRPRSSKWTALDVTEVPEGELVKAKAGAQTLVLIRQGETVYAMHDVCAHASCSLSTGKIVDSQVECPCHGSRYRITDGTVTRGPSVYDQPAYEVRRSGDGWEARMTSVEPGAAPKALPRASGMAASAPQPRKR
jgi:nitrite reductase/ring-hydroxylating ferredoxin subunit